MRRTIRILLIATTGLFSCGQGSQSTPDSLDKEILASTEIGEHQNPQPTHKDQYIDSRFAYPDSFGKSLIIENSLPKGGLKYTDPHGQDYVYAIFWTRIRNETANSFELAIGFPADSIELPSSEGNYFNILLPDDRMTPEKESMFNYGLTGLESFLNNGLHKSSSLQQSVKPKESISFYIVTLFNRGVEGTVRAGLRWKDQTLFYRMNDKEIHCGQAHFIRQ